MTRIQRYKAPKAVNSEVDYGRNWSKAESSDDFILKPGETILTSEWVITSDDEKKPALIEVKNGISDDGLSTAIWVKLGTEGVSYYLTNTITTSEGRTYSRTGILKVVGMK